MADCGECARLRGAVTAFLEVSDRFSSNGRFAYSESERLAIASLRAALQPAPSEAEPPACPVCSSSPPNWVCHARQCWRTDYDAVLIGPVPAPQPPAESLDKARLAELAAEGLQLSRELQKRVAPMLTPAESPNDDREWLNKGKTAERPEDS